MVKKLKEVRGMSEIQRAKRSGKKAVVTMQIEVFVEVDESDNYYDMVQQAEDQLEKRVIPGKGFFPFRKNPYMVQDGITVDELIQKVTVQPGSGWYDR